MSNNENLTCRTESELKVALRSTDKTSVKSISCDRINNPELLSRIVEFSSLESCHLSLCDATRLSKNLGDLKKLTCLNLQACRLTEFPVSITSAKQLSSLSLGNNRISEIPVEIEQLNSLETLSLMQNQLESVPVALFALPLTGLNLSYNQLKSIPNLVSKATKLETLSLAANNLTELPASVGKLLALESLDLRYNQLQSLPVEICDLPSLKYLALATNQFKKLPSELEDFSKSLESFSIDGKFRKLFMDWSYQYSDKPLRIQVANMDLYLSKSDDQYSEFSNSLEQIGAGTLKSRIRKSINIQCTEPDDYSVPGSSRLGGFPELLNRETLPTCEYGIWIFLGQLNLADIADANQFLPRKGLLSFFVRSLEDLQCKVIYYDGEMDALKTLRFDPGELTDDQDDYTDKPFRVEFSKSTSLPWIENECWNSDDFDKVHDFINTSSQHCLNGYTFTQHESPETQAADQRGGTPEEWVPLLRLGYDAKVGFCFWDAGTLTFNIHQQDLARYDFSKVHVSLESS